MSRRPSEKRPRSVRTTRSRISMINSNGSSPKSPLLGKRTLEVSSSMLRALDGPPDPDMLRGCFVALARQDEATLDEGLTKDPRLAKEPLHYSSDEDQNEKKLRMFARRAFRKRSVRSQRSVAGISVFGRGTGITLLHVAVEKAKLSAILRLLMEGAPVLAVNSGGETPFFVACRLGRCEVVSMLIRHVMDNEPETGEYMAQHCNHRGETPLHALWTAVLKVREEVAARTRTAAEGPAEADSDDDDDDDDDDTQEEALLDARAWAGEKQRHESELRSLALKIEELGGDVFKRDAMGVSPNDLQCRVDGDMFAAAWDGDVARVNALLDRAQGPPTVGPPGSATAARKSGVGFDFSAEGHAAATAAVTTSPSRRASRAAAAATLSRVASAPKTQPPLLPPTAPVIDAVDPVFAACMQGHVSVLEAFVFADQVTLTAQSPQTNRTLLHRIATLGLAPAMDTLLRLKPLEVAKGLLQRDVAGRTPFMQALEAGAEGLALQLLDHAKQTRPPPPVIELELLHGRGHELSLPLPPATDESDLCRLLVSIPDADGLSPLHVAAAKGMERAVQALLDLQADVNCGKSMPYSPLCAVEPPIRLCSVLMDRAQRMGFLSSGGVRTVLRRVTFASPFEAKLRAMLVCCPIIHELSALGLVVGGPAWLFVVKAKIPFFVFRQVMADFETIYESLRSEDVGDWVKIYTEELRASPAVARVVHQLSLEAHIRASPAAAAAASAADVMSPPSRRPSSSPTARAVLPSLKDPPPRAEAGSAHVPPILVPSPLHTAVRCCNPGVVDMLLTHGADVAALDPSGRRPLRLLVDSQLGMLRPGFGHVLRALLAMGANPSDLDDADGQSPLHAVACAERNHPDVLRTMLTCADVVDVNRASRDGRTALTVAASLGRTAMVRLLLAHGATVSTATLVAAASRPVTEVEGGVFGSPVLAARRTTRRPRATMRPGRATRVTSRSLSPAMVDSGLLSSPQATEDGGGGGADGDDDDDDDDSLGARDAVRVLLQALGPPTSSEVFPVLKAAAIAGNVSVATYLLKSVKFKIDDLTGVLAALLGLTTGVHKMYPPAQVRARWFSGALGKPPQTVLAREAKETAHARNLDVIAAALLRAGASPLGGVATTDEMPALLHAVKKGWFACATAMVEAGAVPDVEPHYAQARHKRRPADSSAAALHVHAMMGHASGGKRWTNELSFESPLVYASRARLLFQDAFVGLAGEAFAELAIPFALRANEDWWSHLYPHLSVPGAIVGRLSHVEDSNAIRHKAFDVLSTCLLARTTDMLDTGNVLEKLFSLHLLAPNVGAGKDCPLYHAAERGDADLVRFLCNNGATMHHIPTDTSPLLAAARRGHLNVVRTLYEADRSGFEEHVLAQDELPQSRGMTILHYAALKAWPDVVGWALSAEPDSVAARVPWHRRGWFSRLVTPWSYTTDGVHDDIEHHDSALNLVLNPDRKVVSPTLKGVPAERWERASHGRSGAVLCGWQEPRSLAALEQARLRDEIATQLVNAGAVLRYRDRASGLDMLDLACAAGAWDTADLLLRESSWTRQTRGKDNCHFHALRAAACHPDEDRRCRLLSLMSARGITGVPALVDQHVVAALGRSALDELARRDDLDMLSKLLPLFEIKLAVSSVKRFAQPARQLFYEVAVLRAVSSGKEEAAMMIIERTPAVAEGLNFVPVIYACARGNATQVLEDILADTYVSVSLDSCVLAGLSRGHSDAVVTLLQVYDSEAALPLLPLACWNCSLDFLMEVIDDPAGVDLEQQDAEGFSPLDNALAAGRDDVVAVLLTRGAIRRHTELFNSSLVPRVATGWLGAPGWFSKALSHHAEFRPNAAAEMQAIVSPSLPEVPESMQGSSLAARRARAAHRAASQEGEVAEEIDGEEGEEEEEFLLSSLRWEIGDIDHAARHGLISHVGAMIEHGVDLDVCNALHCAAAAGHADVLELLLEAGAHASGYPERTNNMTPLMAAAAGGHMECVRLLHEFEAPAGCVTAETRERNWLHCLARASAVDADDAEEAIELYLQAPGAVLDAVDSEGNTALALAVAAGNKSMVVALGAAGADGLAEDGAGRDFCSASKMWVGSPQMRDRLAEAVPALESRLRVVPWTLHAHERDETFDLYEQACEIVSEKENGIRRSLRALLEQLQRAQFSLRVLVRDMCSTAVVAPETRRRLQRAQQLVPMFLPAWQELRHDLGLAEWARVFAFLPAPDAGRLLKCSRALKLAALASVAEVPRLVPALQWCCKRGHRTHPLLRRQVRETQHRAQALSTVASHLADRGAVEALDVARSVNGFPLDLLRRLGNAARRLQRRKPGALPPLTLVRRMLSRRDAAAVACVSKAPARLERRRRQRHRRPLPAGAVAAKVPRGEGSQALFQARNALERFVLPRLPADRDSMPDLRALIKRGFFALELLTCILPCDLQAMGYSAAAAESTAHRLRVDYERRVKAEQEAKKPVVSLAGLVVTLAGQALDASSPSAPGSPSSSRKTSVVSSSPTYHHHHHHRPSKVKSCEDLVLGIQRRCGNIFSGVLSVNRRSSTARRRSSAARFQQLPPSPKAQSSREKEAKQGAEKEKKKKKKKKESKRPQGIALSGPQRAFAQLMGERERDAEERRQFNEDKLAEAAHSHVARRTLVADSSVEGSLVAAATAYGFQLTRTVRHDMTKPQHMVRTLPESGGLIDAGKCGATLLVPPHALYTQSTSVRIDTVTPQSIELRPMDTASPIVQIRVGGGTLARSATVTICHNAASLRDLQLMAAPDLYGSKPAEPVAPELVTFASHRATVRTRSPGCYYVRYAPHIEDRPVRMQLLVYIGPPLPGAVELAVQVWLVSARSDALAKLQQFVSLPGIDLRLVGRLTSVVMRRQSSLQLELQNACGGESLVSGDLVWTGKPAETLHLTLPMTCVNRRGTTFRALASVDGGATQAFLVEPLAALPGLSCPLDCDALLATEAECADHECPHRAVQCGNGCGVEGLRWLDLPAHERSECPLRRVGCPLGCGADDMTLAERRVHLSSLCVRRLEDGPRRVAREAQLREAQRVRFRHAKAAAELAEASTKQGAVRRLTRMSMAQALASAGGRRKSSALVFSSPA